MVRRGRQRTSGELSYAAPQALYRQSHHTNRESALSTEKIGGASHDHEIKGTQKRCNNSGSSCRERNMPKGKRIVAVRADSAAYQAAIAGIPESDRKTFRDGKIAETIHGMNKTDKAFRLIVLRRPRDSAIRRSLAQAQNFPDLSSNESAGPCKKPLRDLLGYR